MATPDPLIGKTLNGYEITRLIGRGGMATVYEARQISMNRFVALKILPRHLIENEQFLQRFHREVRIIAQLEHRNIIPVYDFGEVDDLPYIVMRYMPYGSLDRALKQPIELDQVVHIMAQIAPALDYAHSKMVLHRDLKPSNILMDESGGAYLTDFGIARIANDEVNVITTQGVVGTPAYMSPEQAQGKELDHRSDLYALGVVLYELCSGRRPFIADTPYGVAVMQVTMPPPLPSQFNPKLPGSVEVVILQALDKRAERRFQNGAELVAALEIALHHQVTLEQTQPARATSVKDTRPRQVVARPQPLPAQPTFQPTPPPVHYSRPPSSHEYVPVKPRAQRKDNNVWMSLILGSVVGCFLLTLLITGLAVWLVNNGWLDGLLGR